MDKQKNKKRFKCVECDFDLCELCMNNFYDRNYIVANDCSTTTISHSFILIMIKIDLFINIIIKSFIIKLILN